MFGSSKCTKVFFTVTAYPSVPESKPINRSSSPLAAWLISLASCEVAVGIDPDVVSIDASMNPDAVSSSLVQESSLTGESGKTRIASVSAGLGIFVEQLVSRGHWMH